MPGDEGIELGCRTVWATFRGVYGPKAPTSGGTSNGPRMYVQVGRDQKMAAHRLAWAFDNPCGDFAALSNPQLEASHLCASTRCCVGTHIAMEPRAYNQSRSYCLHHWDDVTCVPPPVVSMSACTFPDVYSWGRCMMGWWCLGRRQ